MNKIPKGFQRVSALIILNDKKSWDEIIEFNENKLYLEKSIYDKRMRLIFDELARFHNDEIDYWELSERIVDIKNGDYDDK